MMTRVNSRTVFSYTVWGVLGVCLFAGGLHPYLSTVRWFGVSDCYAAEIHTHSKTEQKRTVSNRQLMKWLRKGKYADMQKYLDNLQAKYDSGDVDDHTLLVTYRSFYPTDSTLAARYADWLKAYPDSYVAHLAEGIYYIHVGQKARGSNYINETSQAQIEGMNNAYRKAYGPLMTSLQLNKKPILSYYWLIDISMYYDSNDPFRTIAGYTHQVTNTSRDDRQTVSKLVSQRDLIDAANRIAPHNFIARRKYMTALETRWGHSTQAMITFLHECSEAHLPKMDMQILEAEVEQDKAWNKNNEGALELAAKHYAAAANIVNNNEMFLSEAGYAYMKAHQYGEAIKYLTRAVRENQDDIISWLYLGYSQNKLKDMKAAADAYRHAAVLGIPAAENAGYANVGYAYISIHQYNKAVKYLSKTVRAHPDDINSWLNLGYSYIKLKNMKAAAGAYRHAAVLGNPAAEDEWGEFLWYGKVVPQDCKAAVKLFKKAADKGLADAKKNLYWSKREYNINCKAP